RGLYQGEETIQDNISEDTFNILNNFFINNSVASQGFLKMKPGLLALTLSTIKIAQMGFSPEYGIDMYFCRKATEDKSIIELETMEEQLSLILDMPNQDSYLKYTLHDLEKFDELFEKLIKSWRTGDHKAMENIAIKPYEKDYELQPIFERMYYDRNIRMTSKIKKFLRGNQKVFVVVGAAHLIGEKGIIQLLQKENYSVKQL
ncbi:MAG: TraB/GumN family protein, partial [Desulfobulbaceae bacterium]|nr:TraB/GumN family protein [Desulfobulbaceae bacterium]